MTEVLDCVGCGDEFVEEEGCSCPEMEWVRTGRSCKYGDGVTVEYACAHGIGHWAWGHGCDGCCQRDDYPRGLVIP